MKKTKILCLVFVFLFLLSLITGCMGDTVQQEDNGAFRVVELSAGELIKPDNGAQNATARIAATGANDFAFRLSAALVANAGTDNFVCSPFSVWLPLAALVNATDDQNKPDLMAALSAAGISEADLNNAASRMLYDLTRQGQQQSATDQNIPAHDPLKIANAVFVDNNVTLKKDFAQTFLDYYRGNSINVDFSSADAVRAVNQWASDNTEGLIDNIVNSFDPDTVVAIANAIYFSDRWSWEFKPENTKEDIFHSPTGDQTAFFMQREGDEQVYFEDDRVQAMPLRFKTGGGLYIILPKDGDAVGLLSSMTSGYFNEIQANSIISSGKLLLPRFSIDSGLMDLRSVLVSLGVPLFNARTAPLTGGLIEEQIPVWVSDVVQKALIMVDEKGTTAAAVTVIAAPGAAPPQPTEPFEMICNKPFVFVLYSHTYDGGNQVLFTGVVNKP